MATWVSGAEWFLLGLLVGAVAGVFACLVLACLVLAWHEGGGHRRR